MKSKTFKVNGIDLECFYEEEPSFNVIFDEICAKDCYRILGGKHKEFDYIFDIGANIGLFSLVASSIYPSSKIVCMEPNLLLKSLLEKNIQKAEKWFVPFGNSGEKRILEFMDAGNIYTSSRVSNNGEQCVCLNDFLSEYSPKNYMIKMDCQNAEHVLFNIDSLTKDHFVSLDNAKYVAIEVHDKKGSDVTKLCQCFKNHYCEYLNNILYMERKENT